MKCILMNKNTKVLLVDYNDESKYFDFIYEVYDINYAPYILKSYYNKDDINNTSFRNNLSKWFINRGIPSFREDLDILLHKLNINAPSELLDKAFGLSLSDQYYIRPYDLNIKYEDINFFDNDFNYSEFLEASLSKNNKIIVNESAFITPNNTCDGMLKKAWVIDNNIRYLLKGGYKGDLLQPFNEVLASEICKRLGFNYVNYSLFIHNNMVLSKCPCFINSNTELITCHQIINSLKRYNDINDYENYINILKENGISDARYQLENMFILDFIMMNEDRHLNNFGIIRDVNSLKWLCVAPIFDNGQSLNIRYYDDNEIYISNEGRFFYEVKSFDEIIKVVKDIKRIDIEKLDGIVEWFDELLHKYQYLTNFSDNRINKLCIVLNRQINKLKEL